MKYYRLEWMTRRYAIGLWFYNNIKRHYHNWHIRRMWRADPNRPTICVQAGALRPKTMRWAKEQMEKIQES